jgi:hypothetical protein
VNIEYVESGTGYGWWTPGWVDVEAFTAAYCEDGKNPEAPVHGYVREQWNDGYGGVGFSERPNGGKRATYVWFAL